MLGLYELTFRVDRMRGKVTQPRLSARPAAQTRAAATQAAAARSEFVAGLGFEPATFLRTDSLYRPSYQGLARQFQAVSRPDPENGFVSSPDEKRNLPGWKTDLRFPILAPIVVVHVFALHDQSVTAVGQETEVLNEDKAVAAGRGANGLNSGIRSIRLDDRGRRVFAGLAAVVESRKADGAQMNRLSRVLVLQDENIHLVQVQSSDTVEKRLDGNGGRKVLGAKNRSVGSMRSSL